MGQNFDNLQRVSGRKLVTWVIPGLVVFTILSTLITLMIGRVWGRSLDKKALDKERAYQTQKMLQKEAETPKQ